MKLVLMKTVNLTKSSIITPAKYLDLLKGVQRRITKMISAGAPLEKRRSSEDLL